MFDEESRLFDGFEMLHAVVQREQSRLPPAAHGAFRDLEQFRHFALAPAVVEDQADDFALLGRQGVHGHVERGPFVEIGIGSTDNLNDARAVADFHASFVALRAFRSEERRVGKECRL